MFISATVAVAAISLFSVSSSLTMALICINNSFVLSNLLSCLYSIITNLGLTEHAPIECGGKSLCPHPCRCAEGIVDCREKSLTNVPLTLPEDTAEM